MEFIGQDYQAKQIKKHQKFLLGLLHLHIGNYYPLRKYLGIDYKGRINEITNLSIAYNTKKLKKGYEITRTYQQPDLGYKLNLILDKIPQLALLPALLQPAYGLGALALFFLTQTTYQPSTKDNLLYYGAADTNYGDLTRVNIQGNKNGMACRSLLHFDTSDIPDGATFSQGDISLYCYEEVATTMTGYAARLTQLGWTELGSTWNKYDGTNAWTTAGGDFTTTNQVGINVFTTDWKTWEASTLIQDCYDNQSKNVHLLFYAGDEANHAQWANLYSREYTAD
ncbi:MAG TPA: DNRLRE domain-containing protein, partial [Methanosarcinales archaeon]|nr:DNRLRE domain-containing protein [Methanosarcinales archaeon]